MLKFLLMAFVGLISADLSAQECDSRIFLDSNRNGVRDLTEVGVAGIAVSDGEHIAQSDSNGRYRLQASPGKSLFLIKPPGYTLPRRKDGLPDFFSNQASTVKGLAYRGVQKSESGCRSFALWDEADESKLEEPLSVLVFGDPQPKSGIDIDYYRRDIVKPLIGKTNAQLAISLGDIVHDDLTLLPEVRSADAILGLPWLYAAGNHDLDFDAPDDLSSLESFRQQFGPDTFAWEEVMANFIILDDVIYLPGSRPDYIGGLRESQFTFLEAYLSRLDKTKLLVIAAHIPFFQTKSDRETFRSADRKRLFALLAPFKDVLLLTAHSHTQTQVSHGPDTDWFGAGRLYEYNAGATCGAFWSGVKDLAGIPDTTMSDGTPNGYARLKIDRNDYRLNWFNARQDPNQAMALHAPKVLRKGAYPGFGITANVFMARPDTEVVARIDNGPWQKMQRVLKPDPLILQINVKDDQADTLRSYDRAPAATSSSHLWYLPLPTDLNAGTHQVSVRASDKWLGEVELNTSYELIEANP